MKKLKSFPRPLNIDCSGYSKKSISELADELNLYFFHVDHFADTIQVAKPTSRASYDAAWDIFRRRGLAVT